MKIGIVSDTHFGYKRFEGDSYAQGKEAILKAAAESDIILMAGDILDERNPSLDTLQNVFKIFRELATIRQEGSCVTDVLLTPVAAIHGTHERRGKEEANPIQLLQTLGYLVNVHNRTAIFEAWGEKVAVSGMGGVPEDAAGKLLKALDCKPVKGAFNIFLFHQTVEELLPFGDVMSAEELPKGYDLYVCGHMHKSMYVPQYSLLIPGSTVITQLKKEEVGQKGYYIYDTKGTGEKKFEFRKIDSRPFAFQELNFSNATAEQARQRAVEEINRLSVTNDGKPYAKKPIIKLVLSGTLASGHEKAGIDIRSADWDEVLLFVDNNLTTEALMVKIDKIRELRGRHKNVKELCTEILKEHLGKTPINVDLLFNALSGEGGAEAAMAYVQEYIADKGANKNGATSATGKTSGLNAGGVAEGTSEGNTENEENTEFPAAQNVSITSPFQP
ncbi:hypothetical protein COT30_04630 [Candidatus Micrarchaeota archaeon CG08_land_8_20_14_0_20_49_17]|nr:MAG: hypothetical protein AUJ13_05605 [Candidatus Micrarchaeota archaeon CG1_02_49_24]PIU09387.1 MAG: hypothetical protein COT30_04630 [Candidatus Micrarchaeota archaeon CG08_land_8_20_14_0_20_49_17]PIZ99975.1 MAG: hypothetical protein COX84_00275 [Candidatus Micrarchaeota archaeon CG_4_10_14_0_2_um_filter_49_7]HII53856.1 hypothetical protein [Candidatus Micrarchaeota archaeon]